VERFAYVLDVLPAGRSGDRPGHKDPLAIAVGCDEFKLLEVVLKPGATVRVGDQIPLVVEPGIPPGPADHVRKRISFAELTSAARAELPAALEQIVKESPERFLRFFNEAPAISRRFHMLELLPGIGKKTMWTIVEERKRQPFTSLREIEERGKLKHPEKTLVARIEQELSHEDEKYRLFVPR
jgi:putative nucleotide binding protein